MSSSVAAATRIHYPRFTASQWQELEHQALIFKYMMAGIPVPLDLLHPISESIDSSRFFHHPSLNYCSFYGKKIDPEPGRCRRTDGKKWRCSKDSYPDSKYCERHMHRGRNRSRKPVEMQNISQSSSTVAHLAVPTGGMGTIPSNFSNLPHPISNSHGSHSSPLQIDIASYGIGNKNYRYLDGTKGEADAHSFFSEVSGSARRLGLDSAVAVDRSWSLMSSNMPSLPSAKDRTNSIWDSNYQQYQALQNLEPVSAAVSKQQQHRFFCTEFGPPKPIKQEGQSLRPFLDEWPRNRETWANSEDERSSGISLTVPQLSISMQVLSDFPANASESPAAEAQELKKTTC